MSDFSIHDYVYFSLGLALGGLVVTVASMEKFHQSPTPPSGNDLLHQLRPRHLTTNEEYSRALMLYYLAPMLFVLLVFATLGPDVMKAGGVTLPDKGFPVGVWPAVAGLMIGGLINTPWINNLELMVRRFAHDRAYIPERAHATAERLRAAEYDFSRCRGTLSNAAMRGVQASDFDSPRGSLEYSWARLVCLCHEIDRRRDGTDTDDLDAKMLEQYAEALDALGSSRRSMETRVTEYRKGTYSSEQAEKIEHDVKDLLRVIYLFLACAVLQKHGNRKDMLSAFRPFGFTLAPIPIAGRNHDLVIVGLTVMAAAVFVLTFAAFGVGRLFGGGFWQPSIDFPTKSYDPFTWAASAALVHGTAILVADRLRRRLITRSRWFQVSANGQSAIPANYIRIAIVCGIAGYISLCLLGAMIYGPSIPLLTGAAPYLLMPAATGAFYACHLDNAELGTNPGRLFEIASQSAVTGFCGLVAAPVWLALGRGVGDALDFIALSGVVGALVGATLAWYIPEAARRRLVTPLVVAGRDRVAAVEVAARERFEDAASADQWLRQPIPTLGNISPIAAAADIDKYDNVIGMLRRPSAAVVG